MSENSELKCRYLTIKEGGISPRHWCGYNSDFVDIEKHECCADVNTYCEHAMMDIIANDVAQNEQVEDMPILSSSCKYFTGKNGEYWCQSKNRLIKTEDVPMCNTVEMCKHFKVSKEQRFLKIANEIGQLVEEKNEAYGSSFSDSAKFLKLLYPSGISVDSYSDVLLLARIFDKLKRIATKNDAFGESPYRDICGYGILGVSQSEKS